MTPLIAEELSTETVERVIDFLESDGWPTGHDGFDKAYVLVKRDRAKQDIKPKDCLMLRSLVRQFTSQIPVLSDEARR